MCDISTSKTQVQVKAANVRKRPRSIFTPSSEDCGSREQMLTVALSRHRATLDPELERNEKDPDATYV